MEKDGRDGRDTDWAFRAYEAVRARLPQFSATRTPVAVGGLGDLAPRFDVFLLDAFGVLNIGARVIAGAPAAVADLQARGKRVMVLTNGATYPAEVALAKYRALGFAFAPEDVVASRDALGQGLAAEMAGLWGVMAPEDAALQRLPCAARRLGHVRAAYDEVCGFILLSTADWDAARQDMLCASLAATPRPVLVGNPDLVAPREDGLSLEPGYFAHDLARRTGIRPRFFGKPFANIYDLAFARLKGVDPARVLMVGDTLHTDILGGAAYGVKTALVTGHGVFKGRDYAPYARAAGLWPDYVMDSP